MSADTAEKCQFRGGTSHLSKATSCIPCRRGKTKCDRARPACEQCITHDRSEDCQYEETSVPTQTEILEDQITRLKARIRQLEKTPDSQASVTLSDPYASRQILTFLAHPTPAMPALQEYYHMIMSTAWMVILSVIPQDLVRIAAVLLGGLMCIYNIMHALRPQTLMKRLQLRLLSLEGKLQDAIDSGIMDSVFTAQIERSMGRIEYRTFELYETTLLTSGGILQEVKAVWQGHSLDIIKCLRDVDNLEVELEINRAMALKNQYHFWK